MTSLTWVGEAPLLVRNRSTWTAVRSNRARDRTARWNHSSPDCGMRRLTLAPSHSDLVRSLLVALLLLGRDEHGLLNRFFRRASGHAGQLPELAFDFAGQRLIRHQKIAHGIASL